jgi:hypothetical protein
MVGRSFRTHRHELTDSRPAGKDRASDTAPDTGWFDGGTGME